MPSVFLATTRRLVREHDLVVLVEGSAYMDTWIANTTPRIPVFEFPEQAAIDAARVVDHSRWRVRPRGEVPAFVDVRRDEAAAIIASALARGAGWLEPTELEALLRCYGIQSPNTRIARPPEEAGDHAAEIAGPVALKAIGPLHKSDVGGVALGLRGRDEVIERAEAIHQRVRDQDEPSEGLHRLGDG